MKIVTSFVYPTIPVRNFDWQAVVDGYEPGDAIGHGSTEDEAIANLLSINTYRLHEVNAELLEALKVCQAALRQLSFKDRSIDYALERAYAAIAKIEEGAA